MKIVFINRKKYPAAFSFERLFSQLGDQFVRMGEQVTPVELPAYNNSPLDIVKNINWIKERTAVYKSSPAIYHITGDVSSAIFGMDGPTVVTIHDFNPLFRYGRSHYRYWVYRYLMYEWPARKADAITVISEKTRQNLLSLTNIDPGKVHLIPNFVDPKFQPVDKAFNTDCPVILHVGVKPNKNLGRLARALNGIKCKLEIIGQPNSTDLHLLEENSVDFNWSSGITDEQVRQHYIDCDIVSFVTLFEGFGLPILEAQRTGRPVVTSNITPHRDVAGPGGALLVDPEDTSAIRASIVSMIESESLREKIVEAGAINVNNYGLEEVAGKYIQLYQSLL